MLKSKITLTDLFEIIKNKKFDSNKLLQEIEYNSSNKICIDLLLNEIQQKPFILYINQNQLSMNTKVDNILAYKSCITDIENIETILYLKKIISIDLAEKTTVTCLLVESSHHHFSNIKAIEKLIYFDTYLKKDKKTNVCGKIDFIKLEDHFNKLLPRLKETLFKKKGKYLFQHFLGLKLDEYRRKEKNHIYQKEPKHYNSFENIDTNTPSILYNFTCPICEKINLVNLNKHAIESKIKLNTKNRFQFICEHFHEKGIHFSIENRFNLDSNQINEEILQKIFLYMFNNFYTHNQKLIFIDSKQKRTIDREELFEKLKNKS